MRHDVTVDGLRYRLRPLRLSDAAFVVSLRTDPLLGRYLHPTSPRVEDQERWTEAYFKRAGDYNFIVESRSDDKAEGVIAVYDVEPAEKTAEWGRWILRRGSNAAVESVLLVYTAAIERLRLDTVYCRTAAVNEKVVSFHTSCGLETRRVLPDHFHFGDRVYDAIEQVQSRERWPQTRARLESLAARLASKQGGVS